MSAQIIPLLSGDRDVAATAAKLRDLASALERGELEHVVLVWTGEEVDPRAWVNLAEGGSLLGLLAALELAKLDVGRRALDRAYGL